MKANMYETPLVEVIEVESEGVLCESGLGATNEKWTEQDFGW